MIWYQYIFLVSAVILYGLSQLHIFGKLIWQGHNNEFSFFGSLSWRRKYKAMGFDRKTPAYFGSTTFLVWTTDFYHLAQMLMKVCFSLGIFGITWWSLVGFICWTGIQWGCFKLFSK